MHPYLLQRARLFVALGTPIYCIVHAYFLIYTPLLHT